MSDHDEQPTPSLRHYRISVAGRLSEGFAEGIGAVEQRETGGTTVLIGELHDQSQLHGVLDRLRDLGVEILRLETLEALEPATEDESPAR